MYWRTSVASSSAVSIMSSPPFSAKSLNFAPLRLHWWPRCHYKEKGNHRRNRINQQTANRCFNCDHKVYDDFWLLIYFLCYYETRVRVSTVQGFYAGEKWCSTRTCSLTEGSDLICSPLWFWRFASEGPSPCSSEPRIRSRWTAASLRCTSKSRNRERNWKETRNIGAIVPCRFHIYFVSTSIMSVVVFRCCNELSFGVGPVFQQLFHLDFLSRKSWPKTLECMHMSPFIQGLLVWFMCWPKD